MSKQVTLFLGISEVAGGFARRRRSVDPACRLRLDPGDAWSDREESLRLAHRLWGREIFGY